MHIATATLGLLSCTNPKSPETEKAVEGLQINVNREKTVTNKADVTDSAQTLVRSGPNRASRPEAHRL